MNRTLVFAIIDKKKIIGFIIVFFILLLSINILYTSFKTFYFQKLQILKNEEVNRTLISQIIDIEEIKNISTIESFRPKLENANISLLTSNQNIELTLLSTFNEKKYNLQDNEVRISKQIVQQYDLKLNKEYPFKINNTIIYLKITSISDDYNSNIILNNNTLCNLRKNKIINFNNFEILLYKYDDIEKTMQIFESKNLTIAKGSKIQDNEILLMKKIVNETLTFYTIIVLCIIIIFILIIKSLIYSSSYQLKLLFYLGMSKKKILKKIISIIGEMLLSTIPFVIIISSIIISFWNVNYNIYIQILQTISLTLITISISSLFILHFCSKILKIHI